MPLIKKPEQTPDKQQIRVRLSEEIFQEIKLYCRWADLPSTDYFFEQVSAMALNKDKEWRDYRKSNAPQTENVN